MEDTGENRMKMSSSEVVAKPGASLSVAEAGSPPDGKQWEPDQGTMDPLIEAPHPHTEAPDLGTAASA